jgi:hypothetical protein
MRFESAIVGKIVSEHSKIADFPRESVPWLAGEVFVGLWSLGPQRQLLSPY